MRRRGASSVGVAGCAWHLRNRPARCRCCVTVASPSHWTPSSMPPCPAARSEMPGELQKVLEWFRDYKIPDGAPWALAPPACGQQAAGSRQQQQQGAAGSRHSSSEQLWPALLLTCARRQAAARQPSVPTAAARPPPQPPAPACACMCACCRQARQQVWLRQQVHEQGLHAGGAPLGPACLRCLRCLRCMPALPARGCLPVAACAAAMPALGCLPVPPAGLPARRLLAAS